MTMSDNVRFRPYLPSEFVEILYRCSSACGLSLGRILTEFLLDSRKFEKVEELCLGDGDDDEIAETILGPSFSDDMQEFE
ncbi:hypothetical protein [Hydrogenimonas urashimensis]|uniref:hypothetical protein n=1 Tax=Hydrogenimonas urashimensis TaxID=2740515 RepID=UPI001915B71D|nr:hypothetical protein [Hydrogenimonas urashimensis]